MSSVYVGVRFYAIFGRLRRIIYGLGPYLNLTCFDVLFDVKSQFDVLRQAGRQTDRRAGTQAQEF